MGWNIITDGVLYSKGTARLCNTQTGGKLKKAKNRTLWVRPPTSTSPVEKKRYPVSFEKG